MQKHSEYYQNYFEMIRREFDKVGHKTEQNDEHFNFLQDLQSKIRLKSWSNLYFWLYTDFGSDGESLTRVS